MHQFESYFGRLSCINMFCSLHEAGGLKIDLEIEMAIICIRLRPQRVSPRILHVMLNVLTVIDENPKQCIFPKPILPVKSPQSYATYVFQHET